MILEHPRNGAFKLGDAALATMRSFEQHAPDATEAGGILLGRYICDGTDIVVDRVTGPLQGDTRTRYGFSREAEAHQRAIDEAWESSNGTCNYLGEWHTHAEPYPTPSAIDLDDWRKRLVEARPGEARFFVIVGQREIRVWAADASGNVVRCMPRDREARAA